MILLTIAISLFATVPAHALGDSGSDCGHFLRRYVLHRESAYLILPLVNGDADTSKKLVLKNAADLRRYLESNPDEPWWSELNNLPSGYFREHVILGTEIGPTGWRPSELDGYLELVKSKIAAEPVRAREALLAMANGDQVSHFSPQAHAHLNGRTLEPQDARGVLWLTRALMRESLVRHKLALVNGQLKALGDVLSDEEVFFFAAYPELAAFWHLRASWPVQMIDPTLAKPAAITLPPLLAGSHGTCDLEVSRLNWTGTNENVEVKIRLASSCSDEDRFLRQWYKARWSEYLDLLAQNVRGETPESEARDGKYESEFDSRSAPRGLGFYMFLSQFYR